MILAGDVGGTKVHLALFDWKDQRVDPQVERTYASSDYESFDDLLKDFLSPPEREQDDVLPEPASEDHATDPSGDTPSQGQTAFEAACIGVAGPVIDNRSRTTNLPWTIDADHIAKQLNIPFVRLLNDIEATAYGVLTLRPDELEVLNAGSPPKTPHSVALIAAGTGLGEATLFHDGAQYHPLPSEGGHTDFAPNSDLEIELLRHLRAMYLHVSYERVLSGTGLHAIYEFLRDRNRNEPTWISEQLKVGDPPAVIAEAGLKKQAEIAVQALDLFASIYGAEAGNLALKTMALSGVYLGGGIAPKLISKLKDGTFMRAFSAKGRYKRLLSTIPVRVIMNQKTALLGAAAVAAHIRKSAA